MIRLGGIEVTFARGTPLEARALRGLDLAMPRGQVVTVIGSNGAGKSTLLNVLAGTARPSAGTVLVDDTDITGRSAARRARQVARVFQDPLSGSCGGLSIEENLALAEARGRHRGLGRAVRPAARDRWRHELSKLGLALEGRLGDRMDQLSGGQRQATALLMATLAPLELLLLDEHTAALDPRTGERVLELTRRLVAEGRFTTLMVTHSMTQALALGDRLLMLHEGRIVLDAEGEARAGLTVERLLDEFRHRAGERRDDDALLLG